MLPNSHFGRWVSWDDKDIGLHQLFISLHTRKSKFEIGTDRDLAVGRDDNPVDGKHRFVYFGLRYKRRGKTVLVEKQFPKTKWVPRAVHHKA